MVLRTRIRALGLQFLKAPTLYWIRIEATVRFNRWLQILLFRRPGRIKREAAFLNVGCGPRGVRSPLWYNIDARRIDGVDYCCDAGRGLPFPAWRFEGIFSEHFFEHLPEDEAKVFLQECLRILKPGGWLRLSVPDGELYLQNYLKDPAWIMNRWPGKFRTPMEAVNRIFRQGSEHQFCYDCETLALWLREAGFAAVERASFRQGAKEALLIDHKSRAKDSLYVEARSPERE